MVGMNLKNLEQFQEQYPDLRLELVDGEIIITSPSGLESDEVALEIGRQLGNWVRPQRLGRVVGSSGGYLLPNETEDVRAPDCSFIRRDRLPRSTPDFVRLVPDLCFEVVSKTDKPAKLRSKLQQFLQLGTQVGILVDPRSRTIEVHRLSQDVVTLRDGDVLTLLDVLPGWEMEVSSIWAPEFD